MTEQLAFDVPGFRDARSAVLSPCGRYRYRLGRRWAHGRTVAWVLLNPSTADGEQDDATLRRLTAFSRAWGYGALTVVNLYAWRSTDPAGLWSAGDPVGPDNDRHLVEAVEGADLTVAGWGTNARPERIAAVLALPGLGRMTALAVTGAGQPRHPLYLRGDLKPAPWRRR